MPTRFCILLFDGFSNMVLANAVEPLRAARDLASGPDLSWQTASLTGAAVTSSSGLTLTPDIALADMPNVAHLIVISGYGAPAYARRLAPLSRVAPRAECITGLDTGAWLMAAAGLLERTPCTIHAQSRVAFSEAFPQLAVTDAPIEAHPPRITCASAAAAMDLMLSLITQIAGEATAFDTRRLFGTLTDTASLPQGTPQARRLRRALSLMETTLEEPLPLADLARHLSLSPRSLDRLFQNALGLPPGRTYQLMRLTHARTLATETGQPLAEVAVRCGFSSAAALSRAYRTAYGTTLGAARRYAISRSSRSGN